MTFFQVSTFEMGAPDPHVWLTWPDGRREMRLLRTDAVEAGGQTFPSAWHRDAYIAALRRELAAAEDRIEHLEDGGLGGSDHLSAEQQATRRADAEASRDAILAELARYEQPDRKPSGRRGA